MWKAWTRPRRWGLSKGWGGLAKVMVKPCRAFSLLECLVALLIISGSVLVFEGMAKLVSQELRTQQNQAQADWLIFADQLRSELDGARLVAVRDHKLYVEKAGQDLAFGLSRADDFRKTHADGRGYQPMLFGLKSCQIVEEAKEVRVHLTFKTGEERTWLYDFSPES